MTEDSNRNSSEGRQFDDAATRFAGANRSALHFLMGVQMAMIQEMLFAGFEMLDRTRTEMHLWDEFVSKIASAHSVGNINTMWVECTRHQLDYMRRDTERLLRHGEQMIETGSKLLSTQLRN